MPPKVMKISNTPTSARMDAWRNPIAPPSSRTMRAPTASRPSDLPRLAVSTAIGAIDEADDQGDDLHDAEDAPARVARRDEEREHREADQHVRADVDQEVDDGAGGAQRPPGRTQVERDRLARDERRRGRRRTASRRGPPCGYHRRQMDLDAYSAAQRRGVGPPRPAGATPRPRRAAADELIEHYQAGATHLSVIRTTVGRVAQGDRLSLALSRARLRFTGTPGNPLQRSPCSSPTQLPAALYRVRWLTLAVTAVVAVLFLVFFTWYSSDPRLIATLGSPRRPEQYAEQDFVGYYDANSEAGFTGQVWTNNAWLAAQCIMFGIFGVWTPVVLVADRHRARAVRRDHERVRAARPLLPLHRAARAAGAVLGVRRRGGGAADLLVVDRAGRPHAAAGARRGRPRLLHPGDRARRSRCSSRA